MKWVSNLITAKVKNRYFLHGVFTSYATYQGTILQDARMRAGPAHSHHPAGNGSMGLFPEHYGHTENRFSWISFSLHNYQGRNGLYAHLEMKR